MSATVIDVTVPSFAVNFKTVPVFPSVAASDETETIAPLNSFLAASIASETALAVGIFESEGLVKSVASVPSENFDRVIPPSAISVAYPPPT